MASRKEYNDLAAAINKVYVDQGSSYRGVIEAVVEEMSKAFKQHNSNFNKERFMQAVTKEN